MVLVPILQLRIVFHASPVLTLNVGFDIFMNMFWNPTCHTNVSGWRNPSQPSWLKKTA